MTIAESFKKVRSEIPASVTIVAAAKWRTADEIREAIDAGLTDIGHNYVQEAEALYKALGQEAKRLRWHMIGDLQTNKINKALKVFDVIQTVDSVGKAEAIEKRAESLGRDAISCYIEINIGSEISKAGVPPDIRKVEDLARTISSCKYLKLEGLMTMGPRLGDPEEARAYFRATKEIFDEVKNLHLPNTELKTLSMGMSNSYKVAIEEGANMIRLGTILFGSRCHLKEIE